MKKLIISVLANVGAVVVGPLLMAQPATEEGVLVQELLDLRQQDAVQTRKTAALAAGDTQEQAEDYLSKIQRLFDNGDLEAAITASQEAEDDGLGIQFWKDCEATAGSLLDVAIKGHRATDDLESRYQQGVSPAEDDPRSISETLGGLLDDRTGERTGESDSRGDRIQDKQAAVNEYARHMTATLSRLGVRLPGTALRPEEIDALRESHENRILDLSFLKLKAFYNGQLLQFLHQELEFYQAAGGQPGADGIFSPDEIRSEIRRGIPEGN